jgi:hypothetical protein
VSTAVHVFLPLLNRSNRAARMLYERDCRNVRTQARRRALRSGRRSGAAGNPIRKQPKTGCQRLLAIDRATSADDALGINSLAASVALPGEAPEIANINSLAESLGETGRIDRQCVSALPPKPIKTTSHQTRLAAGKENAGGRCCVAPAKLGYTPDGSTPAAPTPQVL